MLMLMLADVLGHFGVDPSWWQTDKVRVDCPLCGYRDAMFYGTPEGHFRAAFCVGCDQLRIEARKLVPKGRARAEPVLPVDKAVRELLAPEGRWYLSHVTDWNSPTRNYLEGRGIRRRTAHLTDLKASGGGVWMGAPMILASDTNFDHGYVDVHMTKLRLDGNRWVRDTQAVEPYRRLREGVRVDNAVVRVARHGAPETVIVGEGIETVMAWCQMNDDRMQGNVLALATCGADAMSKIRVGGTKIIALMDADEAGERAAQNLRKRYGERAVEVAVPEGRDFADR